MSRLEAVLDRYGVQYNVLRQGEQPMRCPVHDDRVASASLNLGLEVWHCHGCGAGGGPVNMVALVDGIDVARAAAVVRELAGDRPGGRGEVKRAGRFRMVLRERKRRRFR